MSRKLKDLTGKIFGRLTVVKRAENNKHGNTQWLCKCDCGNEIIVLASSLSFGRTVSCGCFASEATSKRFKKHGQSGIKRSRLYSIWAGMKARCNSGDIRVARYYKDRGISVCDEWESFKGFTMDMERSYIKHSEKHGEKNTSLDRIDPNKGYSKDNCRWATSKIQSKNQRPKFILSSYESICLFLDEVSKLKGIDANLTSQQFSKIAEKLREK
jgi:hypothetical protein